jgi:Endonuclease/Exonuclease/phosphatase family
LNTFNLAWWNTGLSPTKARNRASDEEVAIATKMLMLFNQADTHLIALGETSPQDVERCKALAGHGLNGYAVKDMNTKAGMSSFDTVVLFRPDLITWVEDEDLLYATGNRTTRYGQVLVIGLKGDSDPFYLITSHWSSRGTVAKDAHKRTVLGLRLRDKIDQITQSDAKARIVLLGDYNDEPFDESISESIRATRDLAFMKKRKDMFYNPFWRHMSSYNCDDPSAQYSDKGTYFYSGGETTQWHTFDHMMFSSTLVNGESEWQLDEHATRAFSEPEYTALVQARTTVFDHLPIVGRLLRSH